MDENPYLSPQAASEIGQQEPLPLWRSIISLVLIIFGAMYGFGGGLALTAAAVLGVRHVDVIPASAGFFLGLAMLWGGLRLRRRKRPISN